MDVFFRSILIFSNSLPVQFISYKIYGWFIWKIKQKLFWSFFLLIKTNVYNFFEGFVDGFFFQVILLDIYKWMFSGYYNNYDMSDKYKTVIQLKSRLKCIVFHYIK